MLRVPTLATLTALFFSGSIAFAGEGAGVSPKASKLIDFGNGWAITNSMVTGWAVSIAIILFVMWLIGKPSVFPSKGQALVEGLLDGVRNLVEPIVGKKVATAALPLLLCLFTFIVINNWSGLLPGVGTIGWSSHAADGTDQFEPWVRPFSADMNGTIAIALVAMAVWAYLIGRYAGPKLIFHDLFGNKADKREVPLPIYYFLGVIFLAVGLIEVVSIAIRPVSLSFRLFGNVFGGESLLHGTMFAFPFYFLELLIGLVQALVFTLLVSVYIGLICNHGDDHASEDKDGKDHH